MDVKEFSNLLNLDLDSCIEEVDDIDTSIIDKQFTDNCCLRISLLEENIEKLEEAFKNIKFFIENKKLLYDNQEDYIRDLERRILFEYNFLILDTIIKYLRHNYGKYIFK